MSLAGRPGRPDRAPRDGRRDTFELELPNGKRATVWTKDLEGIRRDIHARGTVILFRPPGAEVYEYVAWDSAEAATIRATGSFRHVGSG